MRHLRLGAPLAAVSLALCAATSAGAATAITSTFDVGDDGWRFGSVGFSPQAVTWNAASQSISRTHGFASWGFLAPTAYLGDKSAFIGGTFGFELSASLVSHADRPLLTLTGLNGGTIYSNWMGAPGSTLTPFEVELSADNFYRGTATTRVSGVSDEEFAAIMASLRAIQIFGDWNPGTDTVGLDNVAMSIRTAAAVPEPTTWALMILGFGAAGAALRRRTDALPA
jgi:hypothetical protein